jgi:hypothetical protein
VKVKGDKSGEAVRLRERD